MRKLRIVVSSRHGALPALVLATLAPAMEGCSSTVDDPASASGSATGSGGASSASASSSGASGGEGGFGVTSASSSSTGGGAVCEPGEMLQTFTVEVPAPGVPADAGQICAVLMSPVESNGAAHVTLAAAPRGPHVASGQIEIAPALAGLVVGLPSVAVVDASAPELMSMQVANLQAAGGGFSFDASWPAPLAAQPPDFPRITVKTTFELACGPGGSPTRTVEALTIIQLCDETETTLGWVSSGDVCKVCDIIAEMAPSPIVPDKQDDPLPLARALRLRIVRLAQVGRAVILLAENDGGREVDYGWHPSGGRVVELAPDIVLWEPPDAPLRSGEAHLIQAVVQRAEGAAVASFAWQEAA